MFSEGKYTVLTFLRHHLFDPAKRFGNVNSLERVLLKNNEKSEIFSIISMYILLNTQSNSLTALKLLFCYFVILFFQL